MHRTCALLTNALPARGSVLEWTHRRLLAVSQPRDLRTRGICIIKREMLPYDIDFTGESAPALKIITRNTHQRVIGSGGHWSLPTTVRRRGLSQHPVDRVNTVADTLCVAGIACAVTSGESASLSRRASSPPLVVNDLSIFYN